MPGRRSWRPGAPGKVERLAGLGQRWGSAGGTGGTRARSGAFPPLTSRKFPAGPAREAEGRDEPVPPAAGIGDRGRRRAGSAPRRVPRLCPPGGPWARPRRSPPLALPESRRESPGPAPSAAPRASPESAGQEPPVAERCRHSWPRGARRSAPSPPAFLCFSKPQTCRWLFWSRVPPPAPLSYLCVGETRNFRQKFRL